MPCAYSCGRFYIDRGGCVMTNCNTSLCIDVYELQKDEHMSPSVEGLGLASISVTLVKSQRVQADLTACVCCEIGTLKRIDVLAEALEAVSVQATVLNMAAAMLSLTSGRHQCLQEAAHPGIVTDQKLPLHQSLRASAQAGPWVT